MAELYEFMESPDMQTEDVGGGYPGERCIKKNCVLWNKKWAM